MGDDDLERCRHPVELLSDVFADDMQGAVAAGAGLLFRLDEVVFAREMFGQGSAVVFARLPRLLILVLGWLLSLHLVLGFDGGQGLRQIFKGELQLIGGELFGTPAELMALQLGDDGAQLVTLGAGLLELGLVGVSL